MKYLVSDLYGDEYERLSNHLLVVRLTREFLAAARQALAVFSQVARDQAAIARVDVAIAGLRCFERGGRDLPEVVAETDYGSPTPIDVPPDAEASLEPARALACNLAVIVVTHGPSAEFQIVVEDEAGNEIRLWAGPFTRADVADWEAALA